MRKRVRSLPRRKRHELADAHPVAEREGLGDDDRVPAERGAHGVEGAGRRLEQQVPVLEQDAEVARADEDARVLDRAPSSRGSCRPPRPAGARGRSIRPPRGRSSPGHPRGARGADVEVGDERLAHPVDDRLAEAADHHRDRDRHREADRERGDRDRQPARVGDERARRQPALAAGTRAGTGVRGATPPAPGPAP